MTLIEQVGLEESFQLDDDCWEVLPLKAFDQNHAKKFDCSLVKRNIVAGVVLDDAAELDESLDVELLTLVQEAC